MDESTGETDMRHSRAADLWALLEQVIAGTALIEEVLDDDQPGWDAPSKGRSAGPGGPPQYVRAALHTVWLNVGHILVTEHDVEPWRVPPLVTRGQGEFTLWQFGPDGRADVTTVESWAPGPPPSSPDPVRPVWKPTERLYTLEEARAVLEACDEHDWIVEVDAHGAPTAVVCARQVCRARRPMT